jgi:hypothetical protein
MIVPQLQPGDTVLMDNVSTHHSAKVESASTSAGAQLLHLPAYSPDLAPIEACWFKVKSYLREVKARTAAAGDWLGYETSQCRGYSRLVHSLGVPLRTRLKSGVGRRTTLLSRRELRCTAHHKSPEKMRTFEERFILNWRQL